MVGYDSPIEIFNTLKSFGMSSSVASVWLKVLTKISNGPAVDMLETVKSVLPLALTVAGAILVVTLGWRLFRNFTRG